MSTSKRLLYLYLFLFVHVVAIEETTAATCTKINDCECRKSNGKIMSLKPVDGGTAGPKWVNICWLCWMCWRDKLIKTVVWKLRVLVQKWEATAAVLLQYWKNILVIKFSFNHSPFHSMTLNHRLKLTYYNFKLTFCFEILRFQSIRSALLTLKWRS